MSKKDYIQFANMLHNKYPVKSDFETFETFESRLETFRTITNGIVEILARDNPLFSMERFIEAIHPV